MSRLNSVFIILFLGFLSLTEIALARPNLIVNGRPSRPDSHPFIVALVNNETLYCAGSLIDPEWVITTAHCVNDKDTVEMVIGRYNLTTTEGTRLISQAVYIHPQHLNDHPPHDLALIHLSEPLAEYETIRFATDDALNAPGRMTTAIGWGRDSTNEGTDVLHEIELPILSTADCNDIEFGSAITAEMLCISHKPERGNGGTCFGDSGGPVITEANGETVLLGIPSWVNTDCFTGTHPDGLTRITAFTDWIMAHLEGNPPNPPVTDGIFSRLPDVYEPDDDETAAQPFPPILARDDEPQQHNISSISDEDWLTFTVTGTERMVIELEPPGDGTMLSLTLYDEALNVITKTAGTGTPDEPLTIGSCAWAGGDPLTTGTYYVHIRDEGERTTSTYEIGRTPCDIQDDLFEFGTIPTVSYGETQAHTISSGGDVDWLMITLTESVPILFSTAEFGVSEGMIDTKIELYDDNFALVGEDEDSGYQFFALLTYCDEVLPAGQYFIKVTGFTREEAAPFAYTFTADDCSRLYEPNDNKFQATSLTYGDTQTHRIDTDDDDDWFTFTLTETTDIVLTAKAATRSGAELEMTLLDAELRHVATGAYNDNLARRVDQAIPFCDVSALKAGKYYVQVVDTANESKHPYYDVAAVPCNDAAEPNNLSVLATSLTIDTTEKHALSFGWDIDWFTFTITESRSVGIGVTTGDSNLVVGLYDSAQNLIQEERTEAGHTGRYIGKCNENALPAGKYLIKIHEIDTARYVPEYTLTLSDCFDSSEPNDAPESAMSLAYDDAAEHALSTPTDDDWFTFTLTETTRSVFFLNRTSLNHGGYPAIELYDAEVNLLEENDFVFCGENALTAGTYYVRVTEPISKPIPSYKLLVEACDPYPGIGEDAYEYNGEAYAATVLTPNVTQTHRIFAVWDVDWLTFTLSETADIDIAIQSTTGDMELALYDDTGTEIAYNDDFDGLSPRLELCDLPAGQYTILAQEYLGNETVPEYEIEMMNAPCEVEIPLAVGVKGVDERDSSLPILIGSILFCLGCAAALRFIDN